MIPTRSQVLAAARSHIGDTEVAGGQVAHDEALQEDFAAAYRAMVGRLVGADARRVRRTSYYNLPANTSRLYPATAGIGGMGMLEGVWDRATGSSYAVTGVVPGSGYVDLTVSAHTWPAGTRVVVWGVLGISDDVNDAWTISAPNSTTVRLNGCVATGTWTSGGTVADSPEDWPIDPLRQVDVVPDAAPTSQIPYYSYQGGRFEFPPCTVARQLRIVYQLSGTAPTTEDAAVGVDDSMDFLAHYTAGHFLARKGPAGSAAQWFILACGKPSGDVSGQVGGFLGQMLSTSAKAMQHQRWQAPPFRHKRNPSVLLSSRW